ncbi:ankyrin domain protein (macronuclear) [Tetrahymena thermophila SB210]|uniref:Ankyrin domain protein n=1 Tax=Tetrahymena thermophila (strain SB210) TaxID=312017 RepID=I7MAH1_TETTS|nr:ankyrin domain protein [Tetrahymena thermophila SB210]EAS04583.2 ankyrin domain protein [Tetrahymena thermophila SB210]|eukprot:XP_001024828.2 ankyrin domain protein [Tetrahymena thermophila SB210]
MSAKAKIISSSPQSWTLLFQILLQKKYRLNLEQGLKENLDDPGEIQILLRHLRMKIILNSMRLNGLILRLFQRCIVEIEKLKTKTLQLRKFRQKNSFEDLKYRLQNFQVGESGNLLQRQISLRAIGGKKLIQLSPQSKRQKVNFITLLEKKALLRKIQNQKILKKKTPNNNKAASNFLGKKQKKKKKTSEPARSLMNIDEIKYGLFVSIVEDQNQRFINLFERENVDIDSYLNKYNWTALQTAAYTGNLEIVNYLLSKGADLTITNKRGMSAMDMAMQSGHLHLVDLLNPTNYCSNFGNQISSQSSSFNDDNTLQLSYDESSYSN